MMYDYLYYTERPYGSSDADTLPQIKLNYVHKMVLRYYYSVCLNADTDYLVITEESFERAVTNLSTHKSSFRYQDVLQCTLYFIENGILTQVHHHLPAFCTVYKLDMDWITKNLQKD